MKLKRHNNFMNEGWWAISNVETGQIDWDKPSKEDDKLINAIPGEEHEEEMYNGDGPADLIGACLDKVVDQYEDSWNRKPYMEEVQAAFNFVFNAMTKTRDLMWKDETKNKDEEKPVKENKETNEEDLKFEDIINMDQFLELAQGISAVCMGEYGDSYYNPVEMKIGIVLGDSNPFDDDTLMDWINNTIIKDYKNKDKVNIEIDSEWVPGRGDDWMVFNPYKNKKKFVNA